MPAKVCPRCGAQYQNLKSTTCPQCFAVLIPIDDATAEEFAAARREVEESPEFQQVKAADDERFKEQSFGACLGVAAMTLVTVILAIVFIVMATHHSPRPIQQVEHPIAQNWGGGASTLPVAAATPNEVLPVSVGNYRRVSLDSGTVLTGTLTPLLHASYTSENRPVLDLYALPAGRPTPEQNEFRLGLTVASQLGGENRPLLFFSTEYWHFAILALPRQSATPTEFQTALLAKFQKP